MELVFATHNPNKLKEIQQLVPPQIKLRSLNDIGCFEEIPETADTIEGNAILKANFVRDKYNLNCFADDTGLEVKALNGEPGVYSARYAGADKDSEANMDKLLDKLKNKTHRQARFKTVIVLNINGKQHHFTGICKGHILEQKKGEKGFGYDPIFQPQGSEKSFAEMGTLEKSKLSHRGLAFKELVSFLSK